MSEQHWFSGMLRFFFVSSGEGKTNGESSVVLVRAGDFDQAFRRLLEIGKSRETSYKNAFGHDVRIVFVEVATLDMIRVDTLDGAEVYSEFTGERDPAITFDTPVDPARSQPGHTGI
jgi:hypothetical protein